MTKLDSEVINVLEKSKEVIMTLMDCNAVSKMADIIGEETIKEIERLLNIKLKA